MPSDLLEAVGAIIDPDLRRTLGELGMVVEAGSKKGEVRVGIRVPVENWHAGDVAAAVAEAAKAATGADEVAVDVAIMDDAERERLGGVLREGQPPRPGDVASRTRIVAVASGKGGVGKSSVTANTAVALARAGHDVAVVDADVWGYSIPKMLGISRPPQAVDGLIIPPVAHGVRAISMDFFVPADEAVVWRGPMLHKALEQFLDDVYWDEPEFLLIDMPPGTGDVAISISQFAPRAQALLVTTPQVTAQRVAKRAAGMAAKVSQEVVGVVENMSWFTGDDGKRYEIFGSGGGAELAAELGVELLGQVPLLTSMRSGADAGDPVSIAAPESEASRAFEGIARRLVELRPRVRTNPALKIT